MEQSLTIKKKKVNINLKQVIKSFTLIWGLVLIILMTITNVGIKKDFDFLQWLSNSLILFGIMVFGLLMGESIGNDKQKSKQTGLFQTTLRDYNAYYDVIKDRVIYFNQFYQWFMPQELYDKKLNYLITKGVDITKAKNILNYCTIEDLFPLKEHPIDKEIDGKKIYIRKLNEYEIEPVEKVLKGEIKLHLCNPNYYLTAFGWEKTGSILEEGKEIAKIRRENKRNNRIIKITSTLLISFVWGILTVYDFAKGNDTQAWFNLVSRITALFTSFVCGWSSSVVDVKLQAQSLTNKIRVLTLFKNAMDKNLFELKTEEQLAEEEVKEYEKKVENAKKCVVGEPAIMLLSTGGTNDGR